MLTNKKIGVLLGGTSAEREVSLRSGGAIYAALKAMEYNAVPIDAGPDICQRLAEEKVEIAFLVLHGGWGEDGGIQGLLEVMGIPYTGSGVLASALAMDKAASKTVFSAHGVPVPRYEVLNEIKSPSIADIPASIGAPLVVKPSKEGSSVGVSIVKDNKRLEDALLLALSYGGPVLVEEYIEGREVQIGILNDAALGGVEVRPSLEFYNYEAKYTSGLTEYIIPPELDLRTYEAVKDAALRAHRALGCSGATRVDLIVDKTQRPYVLEVNTIPGMTETSLLPKIAASAGLSFPALVEEMLRGALKVGEKNG